MNYRVLITAPRLPERAMALLEARETTVETMPLTATPDDVARAIETLQPHGIISRTAKISRAAIENAEALRIISKHGAGVDNVDVRAATDHGISVTRTGGANAQSVAEHAMTMICVLARRILEIDASMRTGGWPRSQFIGREISGRTLGLLGFGEIARRLAVIARGFGMQVTAYSPSLASRAPADIDVAQSAAALFDRCDVVSLHCGLSDATRGLVDADMLARLAPHAILINTARGAIVNEPDLIAALEGGRLAGAGLDTFAEEPLSEDSPLRQMNNVVLTPHIGASTTEAMERVAVQAVENLFAVLDGDGVSPDALVNNAWPEIPTS